MSSNSNLEITNFKVDPTSQQISEIYINGEKLETGSEPELQEQNVNIINLDNFDEHSGNSYVKHVEPSVGYDGLSKVNFYVNSAIIAPDTLYEATLGDSLNVLIENIVISSSNSITAFSGNLYLLKGSSAGPYLEKTEYQTSGGPCGEAVTVRISGNTYTTATKGWS